MTLQDKTRSRFWGLLQGQPFPLPKFFSCFRSIVYTALPCIVLAFGSEVRAAAFQESYDFAAEPVATRSDGARGIGALIETSSAKGSVVVRGSRPDPQAPLKIVGEGSLDYRDAEGKAFPARGNRLQHSDDEEANFTVGYSLALMNSSLTGGLVEASTDKEFPERSKPGWGSPNQTLWLSAIIRPNGGLLQIKLRNSAYSTGPNGLILEYSPKTETLQVSQNWPVLGRQNENQAELPVSSTEPTWVLVKVETGPEWGNSAEYAAIHPSRSRPGEVALPAATGKLTIWINPLIGSEPAASKAAATFPLHEMRFDSLWIVLESTAEIDEIRIDPQFSAILTD